MNLRVLFSISILLFSTTVMAMGSKPPVSDSEPKPTKNYTREIPLSRAEGINFDSRYIADFNNDGRRDRLHCDSKNLRVYVRDARNLKRNILYWGGPVIKKQKNGSKRIFTGCDVIYLRPGKPSIVVSTAFVHPRNGVRVRSEQFVIQNYRGAFIKKSLRVSVNGNNYLYRTASRSVHCAPYPQRLVNMGYRPGVLCFFAGYDSNTSRGYGTTAALVKIEQHANGKLVGKDLTPSSGLLWSGGILGTPLDRFPTYKNSHGTRKYDGLHMMGAALLDFDKDGLVDMVTVGQHASIRASKMSIDRSRREGVKFTTSNILKARNGVMTEFLTITPFNNFHASIKRGCVYITGEQFDGNYNSTSRVHDHIRCYKPQSKKWVQHDMPVKNMTSEYGKPVIRKVGDKIWIRVSQNRKEKGKVGFFRHRLFVVRQ